MIEPIVNSGMTIDTDVVTRLIATVDRGLIGGLGVAQPGKMCIEAAVCYALNLPHGDDPICVDPIIRSTKIYLNDSEWASSAARADGLRKLGVLQLGTDRNFNQRDFCERLALMTVKTVVPLVLSSIGIHNHADRCRSVTTLKEASAASGAAILFKELEAYRSEARAVRYAYRAARVAMLGVNVGSVTTYTVDAARYAHALKTFAVGFENILIDMKVPGARFLPLLEAKP